MFVQIIFCDVKNFDSNILDSAKQPIVFYSENQFIT